LLLPWAALLVQLRDTQQQLQALRQVLKSAPSSVLLLVP